MIYFNTEEREPFYWLTNESRTFLKRGYLESGVEPEDRIRQIAETAEKTLGKDGFADKFYDYMSRGWFSLSSPIWSNYGLDRGLPISCFGAYIPDSIEGIAEVVAEVTTETKSGGGTSAYFGHIRGRGAEIKNNGKSDGSFNFAKLFDTTIDVVSQGTSRKGMFAGFIEIDHPDIDEWLNIHAEGNPIQLMYYGVCVGREWFKEMKEGDVKKRKVWAKVLQSRAERGIPYVFFKDNANDNTVEVYKKGKHRIYASNMCSEISLPSNPEESFVCCLSSMNLEFFDEWKDTDAVETLVYFLDTVMSEFIEKTKGKKFMEKPLRFAERHRALGVGALGWHSYLQKNMIAFDSLDAMMRNSSIFKFIKEKAYKASADLATIFGEPEMLKGIGRRNTTLMAVAPTKSSSFILGSVSPSVEPLKSNYFVKDLAKILTTYKNPYLLNLLRIKGHDTAEVWESILLNDGSVQHLDFLSEHEKNVFKTFGEISQLVIIQQAAQRQKYIDQGQSINLMIHPKTPTKDVNQLYIAAEELGLKSLYYQFSINAAQQLNRDLLTCASCES